MPLKESTSTIGGDCCTTASLLSGSEDSLRSALHISVGFLQTLELKPAHDI